jgi:hypothetical protein
MKPAIRIAGHRRCDKRYIEKGASLPTQVHDEVLLPRRWHVAASISCEAVHDVKVRDHGCVQHEDDGYV